MADALLELEEELLDGALRVVLSSVLRKLGAVKDNGDVLPCTCSRTSIKSSSDIDFNLIKAEEAVCNGDLHFADCIYMHTCASHISSLMEDTRFNANFAAEVSCSQATKRRAYLAPISFINKSSSNARLTDTVCSGWTLQCQRWSARS